MARAAIRIDAAGASVRAPKAFSTTLKRAVASMRAATKKEYEDDRAFVNLCVDAEAAAACTRLAKKYRDANLVVLVGIGGPNLAVRSVYEALTSSLETTDARQRVRYADTVDPHHMRIVLHEVNEAFKRSERVLIILASKSGSTTESVANAQVLLAAVKEHKEILAAHVVAITDEESPLWHEARTHGIPTLTIPNKVGGRYSVFSAMGLFPLAVLNIDTTELLAGAAMMRTRCLAATKNPAAELALLQAAHAREGRNVNEYFVFSKDLESVGRWERQLLAESCGKEKRVGKKTVGVGITPTVNVGTNDLHSVGQLALAGPDDKLTCFVTVRATESVFIPTNGPLRGLLPHISGMQFSTIMNAVAEGTKRAYSDAKRPWVAIELPKRDAHSIGQLLQLHLMQTAYLAELLGVNAFDQPAVEQYKEHTRKLLS
jgi:glucose-6-phosphate isomerase